jgi:hypothetical protein
MAFPVAAAFGLGLKLVDQLWTSDEERAEAKLKLLQMQENGELEKLAAAAGIIQAEAQSEHWLTANWRPLTMLVFTTIIANNYIVYPYLSLFWPEAPVLELPEQMFELLKLGIGGYVLGRSTEKGIKLWKAKEGTE